MNVPQPSRDAAEAHQRRGLGPDLTQARAESCHRAPGPLESVLMPIRLLLADDHVLVRQGVRVLLEQAGMAVVGEAADGPETLRLAHTHQPDVAVLDIAMPHLHGLE